MKYINKQRIFDLLEKTGDISHEEFQNVLKKAESLQRLSLEESAALLATSEPERIERIFQSARRVKDTVYGRRVVLFAPLYISNICRNTCLYCGFRADNKLLKRKVLSSDEIKQQVKWLLGRGHKRVLLVAAEGKPGAGQEIDYFANSVRDVYSVRVGPHAIKRVNINCAPLEVEEFRKLKDAGIGTYQIFQETYHEVTYRKLHISGPKSDPERRIQAPEQAFRAGIDDVGIGVLYGLYDWKFETLAMLMHIEGLEKSFGIGPHTISVPRVEPAIGSELSRNIPYPVSDDDFKKLVACLRLSVAYTGIILSTRESARLRDELFDLGVSQVSAESSTSPGGYDSKHADDNQFNLADHRTLEEIIGALIEKKYIPSFCAACYRKERTGEAFMSLAKPGSIKTQCNINALVTLREYLADFAGPEVKRSGLQLIKEIEAGLNERDKQVLKKLFQGLEEGLRDQYV